ncbi:MAG: hypothetical protein A2254_07440 [Ignavibacteria bacterium RIFOXYA2_FULL_35_9]|nr:MAG: hypothetical protein A2254_07440 [Ignavibacteria bacterium RIFOXYA2_FULL_35_9]
MRAKSFHVVLFLFFAAGSLTAQYTFQIVIDEETSKPMLVGLCDRNAFSDTSFSSWFNNEYESYNVDTSTINLITDDIHQVNLTIILGTWCSDSREQIPRLLKILDFLHYPESKMQMFAVDRNKKTGEYDIDHLKIELVPTIIFFKEALEIERIVELPRMSLEEDLVDIILSAR